MPEVLSWNSRAALIAIRIELVVKSQVCKTKQTEDSETRHLSLLVKVTANSLCDSSVFIGANLTNLRRPHLECGSHSAPAS